MTLDLAKRLDEMHSTLPSPPGLALDTGQVPAIGAPSRPGAPADENLLIPRRPEQP